MDRGNQSTGTPSHHNGRVPDIEMDTGLRSSHATNHNGTDPMVITVEVPQHQGGGRLVNASGTQLSLDTTKGPGSGGQRKASSVSLRCGWKLKYQDFLPEKKDNHSKWETKENFQKLVDAANDWLKSNTDVQVKTCQTMTWMSRDVKSLVTGEGMVVSKSIAENVPTFFLRGLRLWLIPRLVSRVSTLLCSDFVPDVIDSTIKQLVEKINKKIEYKQLKGEIVTVETVGIPVVDGGLDSRWTKWMETMDEDVPYAFYLRVFHVHEGTGKPTTLRDIAGIGIKDIVPVATEDGYEGFEDLVERGNTWLRDQTDITITNMQSILVQRDIDNHHDTGSACFYKIPGINSPTAVDFFRILRMVYVKPGPSGDQNFGDLATSIYPFTYETFTPELVRLKETSAKERLEKMNETFSKVIAYLRNSGVDVICAEMVSNPMQLLAPDGGTNQYDEIQFLLTIRLFLTGQVPRWDGSMRSIKRASVASSRARNSPMAETASTHPGPIFLKNVVSRKFPYRWVLLAGSAIFCMTIIVVVSVIYSNR